MVAVTDAALWIAYLLPGVAILASWLARAREPAVLFLLACLVAAHLVGAHTLSGSAFILLPAFSAAVCADRWEREKGTNDGDAC